MGRKVHLEIADISIPERREELSTLLKDASIDIFGSEATYTIKSLFDFIEHHWAVYVAVDNETGKYVGFSSFNINDYFGLRKSTICNSYIYVEPEYRRSKAMHLFSLQALSMCIEEDMEYEPILRKGSKAEEIIFNRLGKSLLYSSHIYQVDALISEYNKIKRILKY